MKAFAGLIIILLVVLGAAELLLALGYLVVAIYRIYERSWNIKAAKALPDGEIFEKKKKSVTSAVEYIEDILRLYENPDEKDTKYRMGANLHERVHSTRDNFARNGITRRLRFVGVNVEQTDKGQSFRKWDSGGKEWRVGEIVASMTEEYVKRGSEELLSQTYYPSVRVTFSMSRRLTSQDKANASHKDKWGRKIEAKEPFYEDKRLTHCPSCGAELPSDLKDVVCPYCNSTIFSDYYDWQIESLEIAPKKMAVRGIIGWMVYFNNYKAISSGVKNKKKQKIVRFSENDFRQDVYEAFLAGERADNLIDMWLGAIEICSIKNTEKDTILKIKVPVYRVLKDASGIQKDVKREQATFARVRYPNRFRKEDAVVSSEKMCPNCGGAFTPDEKGNCKFCGTFLFRDNIKWKRV